MKTITVDILPDGRVKIDMEGFKGGECEEVTRRLLQELGHVESQTFKVEKWHDRVKNINIKNGSGS